VKKMPQLSSPPDLDLSSFFIERIEAGIASKKLQDLHVLVDFEEFLEYPGAEAVLTSIKEEYIKKGWKKSKIAKRKKDPVNVTE
jgi:hypothetical protein